MKANIVAAAILILSSGAMAADSQAPASQGEQKAEKKICRVTKVTGSLTRKNRVCLTASEWEELHRNTKKGLDDFIGDASGGCMAPSDATSGRMC